MPYREVQASDVAIGDRFHIGGQLVETYNVEIGESSTHVAIYFDVLRDGGLGCVLYPSESFLHLHINMEGS